MGSEPLLGGQVMCYYLSGLICLTLLLSSSQKCSVRFRPRLKAAKGITDVLLSIVCKFGGMHAGIALLDNHVSVLILFSDKCRFPADALDKCISGTDPEKKLVDGCIPESNQ